MFGYLVPEVTGRQPNWSWKFVLIFKRNDEWIKFEESSQIHYYLISENDNR